jgi:hypothetical protein
MAFGNERVPVYNLSIPGSPTYYVGEHGLWVHNCSWAGQHHLIPRYLGGKKKWTTTPLTHDQHVRLHSLIDHASKRRNIPVRTQGGAAVMEWLGKSPRHKDELREALVEAYGAFDIQHGTTLLSEFIEEMRRVGF